MGKGQAFQQMILGKLDIQRWKKIAEHLPYTIYKNLLKMNWHEEATYRMGEFANHISDNQLISEYTDSNV